MTEQTAFKASNKLSDVTAADDAGSEAQKGFVDVVAAFPGNAQAFHAVVAGDRALYHRT
jgi:hypothetical protein